MFRKPTSLLLVLFGLASCNPAENKSTPAVAQPAVLEQEKPTGRTLHPDPAVLSKPLGLFLKIVSDSTVLSRATDLATNISNLECSITFEVVRAIDAKALKDKIEALRKEAPTRTEALNDETMPDQLLKNYALLEITLADSLKKPIEHSTMLSTHFDPLNSLTYGSGTITFVFQKNATAEEAQRIYAVNPKFFSIRLSNSGTGISKVFGDYIKSVKK